MGRIIVQDIRVHAYHGCLDQEGMVGTPFSTDVILDTDFSKACESDDLEDTIDYCAVAAIVQEEMAIRSKLIEHVGKRIMDRMLKTIAGIQYLRLEITKIAAPIQGEVGSVKVIMEHGREA